MKAEILGIIIIITALVVFYMAGIGYGLRHANSVLPERVDHLTLNIDTIKNLTVVNDTNTTWGVLKGKNQSE